MNNRYIFILSLTFVCSMLLALFSEGLKSKTLFAMLIATIGVFIIIYNDFNSGGVAGALLGFLAAFGFASFTVAIRWNLKTPKFTTVLIAGLICALFSFVMLDFSFQSLEKMSPLLKHQDHQEYPWQYVQQNHSLLPADRIKLFQIAVYVRHC